MDGDRYRDLGGVEVAPGIWRWTAFHPEWKEIVASAAIESGGRTVLVDPLFPEGPAADAALDDLAAGAERGAPPAIVLSVFFHERSASWIVGRATGTTLHVEASSAAHVAAPVTHPFRAGAALPGGLTAHATARPDEVVLWHAESGTLFVGDVILGRGPLGIELCPDSWLPDGIGARELAVSLAPLLDLPVARILPGHGEPLLSAARARLAELLEPLG